MKNNTLLLVVIVFALLIIALYNTSCVKKENMVDYTQTGNNFKHISSKKHYTCTNKHCHKLNNPDEQIILDLHDLDEYENNYKNNIDWIHAYKNQESWLNKLIREEKNQLENSHAIIECAKNCNISPFEMIEKLAQLHHLKIVENNLFQYKNNLKRWENILERNKEHYNKIENNLDKMTNKYNNLEKNKYTNENEKLNNTKINIERLNNTKKWLSYYIKTNGNTIKYLKEHLEKEEYKIIREQKALEKYEECTKYCNTCPTFNKLSNLIAIENENHMLPKRIEHINNNIKRIDNVIESEKRIVSKNPEIRNYLNCRNKCDDGKILNKEDSCECIKTIRNPTLHKFIKCTTSCNDFDPIFCYNKCVDETLHEHIFNDEPWRFDTRLMVLGR